MGFLHGISEGELAKQLADLLNTHNNLAFDKYARDILNSKTKYAVETHGRFLIGACGFEKQSHSMTEIRHLVVATTWRRQGVGEFLVRRLLGEISTPLVYATIRSENIGSRKLFNKLGFQDSVEYNSGKARIILVVKENEEWKKNRKSLLDFGFGLPQGN